MWESIAIGGRRTFYEIRVSLIVRESEHVEGERTSTLSDNCPKTPGEGLRDRQAMGLSAKYRTHL